MASTKTSSAAEALALVALPAIVVVSGISTWVSACEAVKKPLSAKEFAGSARSGTAAWTFEFCLDGEAGLTNCGLAGLI